MKSFLGHTVFIEITQINTEVRTLGTIIASIKILGLKDYSKYHSFSRIPMIQSNK